MHSGCLRSHLFVLPAIIVFAGTVFGQSSSGTIGGRVVDSSGSVVAGAEIRLIKQVDRSARIYTTTAAGDFIFPDTDPGDYTIVVKAPGFKQFEKKNLHLAASDRLAIGDIQLDVGQVNEVVE